MLRTLALLALTGCMGLQRWAPPNAWVMLRVVNYTVAPIRVTVVAPELGGKRVLGEVPLKDSVEWRLPYADTPVIVLIGHAEILIKNTSKPFLYRLEVKPEMQEPYDIY